MIGMRENEARDESQKAEIENVVVAIDHIGTCLNDPEWRGALIALS